MHSLRKRHKICVDKGSEFYNSSFKKWLKNNDIEMYSTHNEGKLLLRDLLDCIVNEYNYTYHRTIKMKHIQVKR